MARHPAIYDEDELDCLPIVDAAPALHGVKVPNKLHTPSASPNMHPARQTPRTASRPPSKQDWLDVPDRDSARMGQRPPVQVRADHERMAGSASDRPGARAVSASQSPVTRAKTSFKRTRQGDQTSRGTSRSPSRSARSPDCSTAEPLEASSPQKRTRRSSSGLTFKPPVPSALTGDRDLRAAQRARLQEQRLQALAKRRRVEQVDDEEDGEQEDPEQQPDRLYRDEASEEEEEEEQEEQRRPSRPRLHGGRKACQRVRTAAEEHSSPWVGRSSPRGQTAGETPARRMLKRIKPDPDEVVEIVASSRVLPPPTASPTAAPAAVAATPSSPRAHEAVTNAPPLRRYPTPPTASAFLTTLPLPSLARLAPHFHELGCSSPGELLVLCDPAQRPLRDEFLREVADKAGGVSALERMMLHREMDSGWRRWTGAAANSGDTSGQQQQQGGEDRRAQGGTSAVSVAA